MAENIPRSYGSPTQPLSTRAGFSGRSKPASAYRGGCYVDANGNCNFAPFSLATADESPTDMAAYGTTPDQHFAYYVTHDDDAPEFRIMDFPSQKGQALWACQLETNGMSDLNATHALENAGGYTFDQADAITSAADTIYCPWNLHLPPASVNTAPSPVQLPPGYSDGD